MSKGSVDPKKKKEYKKRWKIKTQKTTLSTATKVLKNWSKEEEDKLRKLLKEGKTKKEIAIELNKSFYGIEYKVYYMDDELKTTKRLGKVKKKNDESIKTAKKYKTRWDYENTYKLLCLKKEGKSGKEIGIILGRSLYSIDTRFHKIKKDPFWVAIIKEMGLLS